MRAGQGGEWPVRWSVEAGGCERAAPSQKTISHIRPESTNRTISASRIKQSLTLKTLRVKANMIGEEFNLHAFSQQMGKLLVAFQSTAPRPLLFIRSPIVTPETCKRKGEVAPTHCRRFTHYLSFNKGHRGPEQFLGAPGSRFNPSEKSYKVWNPKAIV